MTGDDRRSPMAIGMEWAARITTLGFEFVIPAMLGHLIDRKLGSNPIALLVGMVLGFLIGMLHLLRIARDASKPS